MATRRRFVHTGLRRPHPRERRYGDDGTQVAFSEAGERSFAQIIGRKVGTEDDGEVQRGASSRSTTSCGRSDNLGESANDLSHSAIDGLDLGLLG